jgi:hypothetical protein
LSLILKILQRRPLLAQLFPISIPQSKVEEIAEKYKRGIAQAIGVAPEDINEEVVRRWAIHWLRAMVKPEAWVKYGLT